MFNVESLCFEIFTLIFSERIRDENYIKVKLPDDILKHFEKQYGINSDDHISNILG